MHIHFMGIGGSGVSGLAIIAGLKGHTVSGCDIVLSKYADMVAKRGIACFEGHSPDHLDSVDLLVCSSAVSRDNPEYVAAKEKGIQVIRRGEFLAKLIEDESIIGVAGTHGKTTTTWLIWHILSSMGYTPAIYAGGTVDGVSAVYPGSPIVVELDESDGSVFHVQPDILVVTNLEHEHVDFYQDETSMVREFERYLFSYKPSRLIIGRGYGLSDQLFSVFGGLTFPTRHEIQNWKLCLNSSFCFDNDDLMLIWHDAAWFVGDRSTPYYVLQNRSGALLAALSYASARGDVPAPFDRRFWETLPQVSRRFEAKGDYKGITLIDDYGHHPSEIQAVVERARKEFGSFAMVFQPHRATRFAKFYDEFSNVLRQVEPLIILPVFYAGEKNIEGKTSFDMYNMLKEEGHEVYYCDSVKQAAEFIRENPEKLRIKALVGVGAGNVNDLALYILGEK